MHMPIRLVNGHQTYSGKCTHVYHPLSIMSITSLEAQYIHKLHYRHLEMLFAQHYVGCTITTGSGISSALPIFLVLQDYLLWTWSEEEEKENFFPNWRNRRQVEATLATIRIFVMVPECAYVYIN